MTERPSTEQLDDLARQVFAKPPDLNNLILITERGPVRWIDATPEEKQHFVNKLATSCIVREGRQ